MSNNASPAPSERGQVWLKRGLKYSAEILLTLVALTLLSVWVSRHMLDTDSRAPFTRLPLLGGGVAELSWPAMTDNTLVYFFAPWCQVCRISMPGLNLLSPEEGSLRIAVVALDYSSEQEVQQFIEDVGYQGEVMLGSATTGQDWQITGYPSYYVVSADGLIAHQDMGISTPPGLWLRTR